MSIDYKTVGHTFGPGETIEAAIRHCNDIGMRPTIVALLVERFNELNPDAIPPKPGQLVQIPILIGFEGKEIR